MATSTRQFARTATRLTTRLTTRNFSAAASRAALRPRYSGYRFYSSSSGPEPTKSSSFGWLAGAAVVGGGAGLYFYSQGDAKAAAAPKTLANPTKEDYQKVYNEIAARLDEKDDYDDGSYGPVLLRLAWHASGTYDKLTGTGGSNGATMRFAPEGDHGANAGLKHARDFLEPVKGKHLDLTRTNTNTYIHAHTSLSDPFVVRA